jgi:signal transduction histidine kinase
LRSTLEPNVILETGFENNLPRLFADATQLNQVIMNLCVNASHAMKNGGKLTMSVRATTADAANCSICGFQLFGRHLELCVTDTGHGMDQVTMRRIFDPFFTTKPVGEGTGLGLAVTHGIIAHHGGHICVQSEVGQGTAFHIYLPAANESDNHQSAFVSSGVMTGTPIPFSR